MEYVLVPVKDKVEKAFLLNLLKKMQKKVSILSANEIEDLAFISVMNKSRRSGKGSLAKVKSHLLQIASDK